MTLTPESATNFRDVLFGQARLKLYGWLSLATQIGIVVTGGAVRLTGSGLGCPTWPRCTAESFVSTPEMGFHGVIEFGNRLLTFVLLIVAILTFITVLRARKQRKGLLLPAFGLGLGIIVQAVIGGITVLTGLNSWVVGLHFLVSGALIALASLLVWRIYAPTAEPISQIAHLSRWPIIIFGSIAIVVGVVVTGAGPHAGDANTPRNGLNLEIWQHYHSYPAYIMTGLMVLALISQWQMQKTWSVSVRALAIGTLIALSQAVIGVIQARTGVPALLVGIHMLGAALICSAIAFQAFALKRRY
ncbi:MAG: COX15/CtaA family protein [Microbacteriaceae bacterium]|nr:COX15/CtaA family protein [Microbacteriaceae bacterium]MDR9443429.1 COX15/CtaA family protein [Microbacteriaceae bacterium]